MLEKLLDLFFPFKREEWCHCSCDGECFGKLVYCIVCDEGYCEACIETCGYFHGNICDWCWSRVDLDEFGKPIAVDGIVTACGHKYNSKTQQCVKNCKIKIS